MQNTGKQTPKPMKPSPNPGAIPNEPDRFAKDHEQGEGSYSGTRDYQKGVKAYLERANVEQDARNAAPANADVERELEAGRAPAKAKSRKNNFQI